MATNLQNRTRLYFFLNKFPVIAKLFISITKQQLFSLSPLSFAELWFNYYLFGNRYNSSKFPIVFSIIKKNFLSNFYVFEYSHLGWFKIDIGIRLIIVIYKGWPTENKLIINPSVILKFLFQRGRSNSVKEWENSSRRNNWFSKNANASLTLFRF